MIDKIKPYNKTAVAVATALVLGLLPLLQAEGIELSELAVEGAIRLVAALLVGAAVYRVPNLQPEKSEQQEMLKSETK